MNGQAGRLILWSIILISMVAGCSDDPGKSPESPPSLSTSTPSPNTTTPAPPDRPALNIQFIGAADLSDESKSSLADLIESIQASVVQITTSSGSASGFIITADGLVITNEHVVSGESSVGVWLTTGRRYDADVLERDATLRPCTAANSRRQQLSSHRGRRPEHRTHGRRGARARLSPCGHHRHEPDRHPRHHLFHQDRRRRSTAADRCGDKPGQQRRPTRRHQRRGHRRQHSQDRGDQ